MVTPSFNFLKQEQATPKVQVMDIKELTNEERRALFIKQSDQLKRKGLKYVQLAEAIGINEKRMRNIRSTKPPHVFPTEIELENLQKVHKRRFAEPEVKDDTVQAQLKDLQERMKDCEAFTKSKKILLLEKILSLAEKGALDDAQVKSLSKLLN